MPGGVSSPVRAMRSVGRDYPLFLARGAGGEVWDVDGNRYVDWVQSWGPLIAGHAHPDVVAAVTAAAEMGTSFGAPTELELELARELVRGRPLARAGAVRLVRHRGGHERAAPGPRAHRPQRRSSSSPAATTATPTRCWLRPAPALRRSASRPAPASPRPWPPTRSSAGTTTWTACAPLAERHGDDLAAVIVEPVAGNMGVVSARSRASSRACGRSATAPARCS